MSTLIARPNNNPTVHGEEDWISVSDLMSALMMIFLLLAIFFLMYMDEDKKRQAIDEQVLVAKTGDLEQQLAGAKQMVADQARLISEAQSQNKALFSKTGELENKLAQSDNLLAEKNRMLSDAQSNNKALFSKSGDMEKILLSSQQLVAEKSRLLSEATNKLAVMEKENELKTSKIDAVVAEAVIYEDVIKELRQSLLGEFNNDLKKWNAELRDDLTFRFNEPTTLFSIGKATLKPKFQRILSEFFPRYLKVITSDKFRKDIAEVRIEGHTSSIWGELEPNSQEAYFNNMELSQNRSRNTLFFVTQLPEAGGYSEWLKSRLTANGLSSSKLVDLDGFFLTDKRSTGEESKAQSQRVEFRVRIDAESKITKIIDSGKKG